MSDFAQAIYITNGLMLAYMMVRDYFTRQRTTKADDKWIEVNERWRLENKLEKREADQRVTLRITSKAESKIREIVQAELKKLPGGEAKP